MKQYDVAFEIAGPTAMFTRPDSGSAPVSYPAPTFSAVRGMFDSIARLQSAVIIPLRVEICTPIQFYQYVTNYGGPNRQASKMHGSYQLPATVLLDVCYRVFGRVEERRPKPGQTNHLHHLQEMFSRRLKKGQFHEMPCLGWKEFVPQYVGPLRESSRVDSSIDLIIPSMLHSVFDHTGKYCPVYRQNVRIAAGELVYAQ